MISQKLYWRSLLFCAMIGTFFMPFFELSCKSKINTDTKADDKVIFSATAIEMAFGKERTILGNKDADANSSSSDAKTSKLGPDYGRLRANPTFIILLALIVLGLIASVIPSLASPWVAHTLNFAIIAIITGACLGLYKKLDELNMKYPDDSFALAIELQSPPFIVVGLAIIDSILFYRMYQMNKPKLLDL